ncbi:MAG: HYR domain-containing protein, partial [Bacteroidetes bacterium]|nr:HYR domain-containing protein [Bacteroidota bacterium]
DPNTSVTGVVQGVYSFTWTIHNHPCSDQSATVTVTVYDMPAVDAGPDATVCAKDGEYFLGNASAGDYTNLAWQTSGNGTFDYYSGSATYLNPIYHFGSNDLIMGQVNITLTGQGNPPCLDVSDMMMLTLTPSEAPTINCPPDQTLYLDSYCEAVIPDYTSLASITGDCVDPLEFVQTPPPGTTVSGVGTVTVSLSAIDALTLVSSDQTTKTFNPGTLSDNTTYYWKVVAKTSDGTTYPGSVWTFETGTSTPANWQCGDPLIDTRDGQSYNTVMIGTQCWMSQNLNIGTMVQSVDQGWPGHSDCSFDGTIEKYCYGNDPDNCTEFGGLYDWDEMMWYRNRPGIKGICPTGWHLPTDQEWCSLGKFADPSYTCSWSCSGTGGAALKETGTVHWNSPNAGATNSSGFTAIGGGTRDYGGFFYDLMDEAYFWTSTLNNTQPLFYAVRHSFVLICHADLYRTHGMSVRCMKDTPPSYGSLYQPVNPNPPTGSVNQSVNSVLTWDFTNPGNDPVTYDVYLGTRGIESSCTFNVNRIDQIPPVARCKNLTIQVGMNGQVSINEGDVDNGSTDNCGISQYQVNPNSFNNSNVGPNVVTLTVIDGSGNSSTCTCVVTIIKNCPPTMDCPEDITVCADPGQTSALVYPIFPILSPTCPNFQFFFNMTGATSDFGNIIPFDHVFNVGITTVVYEVSEANGPGSHTCSFTVEVVQYQEPDAGQDITGCEISSANLTGNTPDPGYTPLWQQQSGPTAGLSQNGVQALITGLIPGNTYVFGYTLSNDVCSRTDYVTIKDLANTEAANAGLNFSVCNTGGFTLHGNTPTSGSGEWTLTNGPNNPVFDPGDPNTSVTGVVQGVYSFTWTIHNHPCSDQSATVTVTVYDLPTVEAGSNAVVCANEGEYFLWDAFAFNYMVLSWESSGDGWFDFSNNPSDYMHPVYHFGPADLAMGWVSLSLRALANPPCTDAVDNMILTLKPTTGPNINCPPDQTLYLDQYCEAVLPDYTSMASITGDCVDPAIVQTPPPGTLVGGPGPLTVTLSTLDPLTLVSSGQSGKSYDPGTLADNTTYYWKVVAKTSNGNTYPGSVWKFETGTSTPPNWKCGDPFIDARDGQPYNTVSIGNQCWMSQNLNVGSMVTNVDMVDPHSDCSNDGLIEKYCYNNNPVNCQNYGGLYDWDEMMKYKERPGSEGICPYGWHLPTDQEWCSLGKTVDPAYNCGWNCSGTGGGALRETGTTHWYSPNTGATNSSGFTALGAGIRFSVGHFTLRNYDTYFWTSSLSSNYPLFYAVDNSGSHLCHSSYNREFGFSVRCLKDAPPSYGSPYQPVNPYPPAGSTNQSVNSILSWDCTNPGTDPLTYDVYFGVSGSGNSSCTFNVNKTDLIPPVARCKDLTVQLDLNEQYTLSLWQVDDGSTDNCGITQYLTSPNSFNSSNIGANVVTLTVIDGSGNSSSCTCIVTVIDNCPPTMDCPEDIIVCADPGQSSAWVYPIYPILSGTCYDFNFFYNMMGATWDGGNTIPAFHEFNIGVTTVTYFINDANGPGYYTCTFTVTVNPLPDKYLVMGGGSFCEGGNGNPFSLDGSQAGVYYHLYKDGQEVNPPQVSQGSGGPFTIPGPSEPGTYTILAVDAMTNCQTFMNGSAVYHMNPNPVAEISKSIYTICLGDPVTLTVNFTAGTPPFAFEVRQNSLFLGIYHSPTYSFLLTLIPLINSDYEIAWVTDGNNCATTTSTGIAQVIIEEVPEVMLYSFSAVCLSESPFQLTGGIPAGGSYSGDGITDPSGLIFNPGDAGVGPHVITYTYSTPVAGCKGYAYAMIDVLPLPELICPENVETTANSGYCSVIVNGIDPSFSYTCPNLTLSFSATGATVYTNQPGSASGQVFNTGVTTVTYTATDQNGNTVTCSFDITVSSKKKLLVFFYQPPTVCVNSSPIDLNIYVAPQGGIFQGVGIVGNMFYPDQADVGSNAITYLYTDGNACVFFAVQHIMVKAAPIINIEAMPWQVCIGQGVTLTASGADTYVWDNGLGAGNPKTDYPTATTTYNVTGTDSDGCQASNWVIIPVFPIPMVVCQATPSTIFSSQTTTLNALPNTYPSYTWDHGPVFHNYIYRLCDRSVWLFQ